jgi:hypothetical protein
MRDAAHNKRALQQARKRLDAAEAHILRAHSYGKWQRYDAKLELRKAREEYEAAVIAKVRDHPKPPLDYPPLEYWFDVALPLRDKEIRLHREGAPWADRIYALYAWVAASEDYEAICATYGQPNSRPLLRAICDGVVRTGKTKIIDGVRVPYVERKSR